MYNSTGVYNTTGTFETIILAECTLRNVSYSVYFDSTNGAQILTIDRKDVLNDLQAGVVFDAWEPAAGDNSVDFTNATLMQQDSYYQVAAAYAQIVVGQVSYLSGVPYTDAPINTTSIGPLLGNTNTAVTEFVSALETLLTNVTLPLFSNPDYL